MVFTDKIISFDDLYDAYENAKFEVGDICILYRFHKILTISNENLQHEVVKRTCERLEIKYGRQEKK